MRSEFSAGVLLSDIIFGVVTWQDSVFKCLN